VLNIEQKVYKGVCVVHPTQAENDTGVEVGQVGRPSLDDGRNENGKGGAEDRRRLFLDHVEFGHRHFFVPERPYRGDEAEEILHVDCHADADP